MRLKINENGIALVAVLAILVVLAIMAATFVTLMNIESKQSEVQVKSQQLDMLINSGLEHGKAILTVDELNPDNEGVFSYNTLNFKESSSENGLLNQSKWIFVKDAIGRIFGRYRIYIEDEAGKVNVQKVFLTEKSKGTGWDTGEIALPQTLGTTAKTAKKLIDFRYGKNKLPGTRGDDDQNNLILMADGIDNNANGIVDEYDEGINDPREYSAEHLNGDDRKFSSMTELMNVIVDTDRELSSKLRSQIAKKIPQRATIYSCDYTGSPTLPDEYPSDINSLTTRECRKVLIKANAVSPFEPNSTKQMQLAANLIDYRDENHVLSTLGSTYGVEAICFNEILANDETYTVDPSYAIVPDLDKKYWRENCGSIDGGRMFYLVDKIYDAVPDDPGPSYVIDPRQAWRINKKRDIGNIQFFGDKVTFTFPKTIGKRGTRTEITPYNIPVQPPALPGNKSWCVWHSPSAVVGNKSQMEKNYSDLLRALKKLNSADGNRPLFPENYFRNSQLNVYKWSDDLNDKKTQKVIGCFKIISGNQRKITIFGKDVNTHQSFSSLLSKAGVTNDLLDLSLTINSWSPAYPIAGVPSANRTYLLRARKPESGKYFKIVVGRPAKGRYTPGYPKELGVSGNVGGKSGYEKSS